MDNIIHYPTHYPWLVFALSFITMWLSARIGRSFLRRRYTLSEEMREEFNVIQAATLTLLALIIGFSFRWRSAGTINGRILRRKRPTRLAPNTFGPTCYRLRMGLKYGRCYGATSTNGSCFIDPTMIRCFSRRSAPARTKCKPICGPQSRFRPPRSRPLLLLWSFRA